MSDNNITIKSDKAAYNILCKFHSELVNAIDGAMTEAGDAEDREILVGLITGTARHLSDKTNKTPAKG